MVLNTLVTTLVMLFLLTTGSTALPGLVLALRGILILSAFVLITKKYVSWVRRGELAIYYLAEAAVAGFNLIYLSFFYPVDVSILEFSITGTLLTPILNVILVLLLNKLGGRYVTFEQTLDTSSTSVSSVKAVAVKSH